MKITGVCVALGAGFGLGMLFAPRAGNKTRSLVRKQALHGVSYVKRRSNEAREGAAELFKDVTDRVARKVAMS